MYINCKLLIRAINPIHHGEGTEKDEKGYLITRIKKMEVFLKDGSIAEVPILYGNSLRGIMRDISAESFIENSEIKREEIPLDYQALLWSAGILNEVKVRSSDLTKIAKLFPPLSLFGFSFGNDMLSSKMIFSHIYPVTQETMLQTEDILDVFSKKIGFKPIPIKASDIVGEVSRTRTNDGIEIIGKRRGKSKEVDISQMIWTHEFIKPGIFFVGDIQLTNTEKYELGCFLDILERYSRADKLKIGGLSSIGYGRIKADVFMEIHNNGKIMSEYLLTLNGGFNKKLISGEDILEDCTNEYRKYLKSNLKTVKELFKKHSVITEKIKGFFDKIAI